MRDAAGNQRAASTARNQATGSVGDRIAVARRRRGMSRRALAEVVGRSEEWLRQIENGQRRLDSIDYALRLARALRIGNLMTFLGIEDPDQGSLVAEREIIAPIREALMDSIVIQAFLPQQAWDDAARTIDEDIHAARQRWLGTGDRYHRTLRLLPRLLHGAAARLHAGNGPDPANPAIAAYHLARTVLSRTGEEQLAQLAADRALTAAQYTQGPPLVAAAWHFSACYLAQGAFPEALRFALAADLHCANLPDREGRILSGALRLIAAEASAAMLDAHRAYDLLEQAKASAAEVGDVLDPHLVPFGPTEAGICAVQIALRLGHSGEAVRLASSVDMPDDYPPDRQARHYIPLAHLHSRRNEDAAAVFALTKVAAISPEDIRYDHLSREALSRLLRRNNLTVRRELARLARIAGFS